jgi:hypothetical protein
MYKNQQTDQLYKQQLTKETYNKDFLLTYFYYDKHLRKFVFDNKFNEEDVTEFEDMSSDIYRAELLEVFGIEKISEIGKCLDEVLTNYPQLSELANSELQGDPVLLFSYDYFFYTHQCIKHDCSPETLSDFKTYMLSQQSKASF